MSEPGRESDRERQKRVLRLQMAGMGLEFGASVIGGLVLGYMLDDWLGTEPWLFLVGTFGGLGAAVVRLVQLSRRFDRLRQRNGT